MWSLPDKGMPTFTIGENAAWDHWEWNDEIEGTVRQADALYFGTLGQRGESSREGILQGSCHGPRSEHSPYSLISISGHLSMMMH